MQVIAWLYVKYKSFNQKRCKYHKPQSLDMQFSRCTKKTLFNIVCILETFQSRHWLSKGKEKYYSTQNYHQSVYIYFVIANNQNFSNIYARICGQRVLIAFGLTTPSKDATGTTDRLTLSRSSVNHLSADNVNKLDNSNRLIMLQKTTLLFKRNK